MAPGDRGKFRAHILVEFTSNVYDSAGVTLDSKSIVGAAKRLAFVAAARQPRMARPKLDLEGMMLNWPWRSGSFVSSRQDANRRKTLKSSPDRDGLQLQQKRGTVEED
jgi:hypothetical protein